jgi:cytochrome c oxidase subunit 2
MRQGSKRRFLSDAACAGLVLFALGPAALAEEPVDWQLGMQAAASPVRDQIDNLHDGLLLPIITVITVFVLGLLLVVMVRFRASAHPVPTKTTHNTVLELAWTTLPIIILIVIAVPSFRLLYYVDRAENADLTLKVTGHQWYWTYEYPDQGLTDDANLAMDSNLLVPEDQPVKPGQHRLLDVDNPVVLPVGAKVRILVSGTDVIHSWFVPSLGVQTYAVQGRANEVWTEIERPGTYYGQCNQICGIRHPFMPIEIKAVSKDEFDQWVASRKAAHKKAALGAPHDDASPRLAAATAR